ncbi:hypothetical protein EI94DRAFT_889250 [Lactarius quietus]|nr:hypothetical protein EI94DRAFT_889250 [Lactarius quietus]
MTSNESSRLSFCIEDMTNQSGLKAGCDTSGRRHQTWPDLLQLRDRVLDHSHFRVNYHTHASPWMTRSILLAVPPLRKSSLSSPRLASVQVHPCLYPMATAVTASPDADSAGGELSRERIPFAPTQLNITTWGASTSSLISSLLSNLPPPASKMKDVFIWGATMVMSASEKLTMMG